MDPTMNEKKDIGAFFDFGKNKKFAAEELSK
jgi:hypothetical protein